MPTPEEQRILNQINNSEVEKAGWTAAAATFLFTSLLFLLIFIPIAQQEAVSEYIIEQAQNHCPTD